MEAVIFLVQNVWRSRFKQTSQLSSSAVSLLWKQSEPEESTYAGVETKANWLLVVLTRAQRCHACGLWFMQSEFGLETRCVAIFHLAKCLLCWINLVFKIYKWPLLAIYQLYHKSITWRTGNDKKPQFSPHLAFINHPDLIVILEFEHACGVSKTPNFFWNTWSALVDVLVKCGW